MDIHLVLSVLTRTSMLVSILAINKASVYFFITHNPNKSVNQIKKNWMGGTCSTYGVRRGIYRGLKERTEGKR